MPEMNFAHRTQVDFADIGLPPGSYARPDPYDMQFPDIDGYKIAEYLWGRVPAEVLSDTEKERLREEILKSTAARTESAVATFRSRVPRRYREAAHDDPRVATWAHGYATDRDNTQSLLIVGPTGTGKTHLGWCAVHAAAHDAAENRWVAKTAADLYASLRPRHGVDSEAEFTKFAGAPLLFLDDIAAAKPTEWTEEITYRLINHRYEQCLPGIFTSNVPPTQLRDILGERIASRLTEMCERIVLRGEDLRKGGPS